MPSFEALPYDELDSRTRMHLDFESMARDGQIYDSGKRRNGQIVWKTVAGG